MPDPGLLHSEPLPLHQATADPYHCRRHSDTERQIWLSLCRVSCCAQGFSEWFYEDLQDLLELTPKKDVLFIIGDWNAKVGSQEIWSNKQIWPWSTK